MEDVEKIFAIIGKLYYDLIRSQNVIDSLKQQLQLAQQHHETPNTIVE